MIICVCNLVVVHMLKDADTHPQYPFGDLVLTWYTFVLEAAVKTSTVTGLAALFFENLVVKLRRILSLVVICSYNPLYQLKN